MGGWVSSTVRRVAEAIGHRARVRTSKYYRDLSGACAEGASVVLSKVLDRLSNAVGKQGTYTFRIGLGNMCPILF